MTGITNVYIHYGCNANEYDISRFGTFGQWKEVSYDIVGPDYINPETKVLYKHIEESKIERLLV